MPRIRKHAVFVTEPIKGRKLKTLPGIGKALEQRLKNKRIPDAKALLGGFVSAGNKSKFEDWMKRKCKANKFQAGECYDFFKEWSKHNIPQLEILAYLPVTKLSGLQTSGRNLSDAGYPFAKDIFGMYLLLEECQIRFITWLTRRHAAVNNNHAQKCFNFLHGWSEKEFLERNPNAGQ
ncbi:hypothetical protein V1264_024514 [Littorina saxatilis]|uniref:Uncharacterized protein n=1 Tax=Littorina saxatilis TaxID=31220 RepID=A0AAN9FYX8_9CAEN